MVGARLERVGQVWRWLKPYLLGLLVVMVVTGAIWALIYVPKLQVPVCPPGKEGLPPKICFDIENEARKTLAYIMGGILAIIGITLAMRRVRAAERQVLVAQEGQITERVTRAIEQLGSDKMEVRLGGIYALERIANDSDKDYYWTIMETLTSFVRENAPWRELSFSKESISKEKTASFALNNEIKPTMDIQAKLTVLGRRKYRMLNKGENIGLDLTNTDLRGATIRGHMEYAFFMNAHMESASLNGAHLEGAFFWDAHLEEAFLHEACLEGADLRGAFLERAIFWDAHLERANLWEAHLEGAMFKKTHLEGAYLGKATGLTPEQLAEAIIDDETTLPDYLQEKYPKDSGPEGDQEE